MLRRYLASAVLAAVAVVGGGAGARGQFTPGNLVVVRIGDGTAALSAAATATFLDQYTPGGALVNTTALGTTAATSGNRALTNSGAAGSEGALSISPDGRFLALGGYNATAGTAGIAATTSTAVNRVVGVVNISTGAVDTTTALSDAYNTNNIRSAVYNGGNIYTSGTSNGTPATGGTRLTTLGGTTSTQISSTVNNTRVVNIFNGQLYTSSASGSNIGINTVGTGTPITNGQTTALLSGTATATNAYAFVFLNRNGSTGVDTLYVADQTAGLLKFSSADGGSTFTARGSIAGSLTGITAVNNGASVTLFATNGTSGATGTNTVGGNNIVAITDTGAFDASLTGGSFTTLATASTSTVFRGIQFIPAPVPEPATVLAASSLALAAVGGLRRRRKLATAVA